MNIPDYSNKENYKYLNDYQYFYDKCSACNFHYSDKKYLLRIMLYLFHQLIVYYLIMEYTKTNKDVKF